MINFSLAIDLLAFTGVFGYLMSLIFFRSPLFFGEPQESSLVVKRSLIGQHIVPKAAAR